MSDEYEAIEASEKPVEGQPAPEGDGVGADIVIVPLVCMACWSAFEYGTVTGKDLPDDAACPFCGKGPIQPVGKVLMALGRGLQLLERGVSMALEKMDEIETRLAGVELFSKPVGGKLR